MFKCVITKIWNTERWTLSLQLIEQVIFEKKEIANLTVIDSGKLPAESYPISIAHQKAVKMEITSVCRQQCYNLHPWLTWMSRGRAESLKPTGFCFSLRLETIHSQDTFLSCEGWEKWKSKSSSGKYLALNMNCKSAKTPELPRLLSKLSSVLGLLCTSIKLLCLIRCQVPRSSWPRKTHLRICHPARPYKPIAPLFVSGLLRFCQGVFLSYFSKSSKVSLVCSVGFLLKPKVGKSYEHKNQ